MEIAFMTLNGLPIFQNKQKNIAVTYYVIPYVNFQHKQK